MRIKGYSDTAWIKLEFSDGSECVFEANHGGYCPNAIDEYPDTLTVYNPSEILGLEECE